MSRNSPKRKNSDDPHSNPARSDEHGSDPTQVGPESAGQSGDTQGLPASSESSPESVEELAAADQAYESEVIEGVEDAGDHPERPVRVREDRRPSHESELPPDPDWK